MSSLSPLHTIGNQVDEAVRLHRAAGAAEAKDLTQEMLRLVGFPDPNRAWRSYPFELSGGLRQRAMIAMALVCRPALVVADEPTASLDPTTQREILTLFQSLRDQLGIAFVFITHNPTLLAGFADRVLVLYAGKIAELGPAEEVLFSPQHPYTQVLLRCIPRVDFGDTARPPRALLPVIAGTAPSLAMLSRGCVFEPRCEKRMDTCQVNEPIAAQVGSGHEVSCLKFPA